MPTDTDPTAPASPPPSESRERAVWPLLLLTFGIVTLAVGVGLLYVMVKHPALAVPVMATTAVVTLLVTVAVALARR